MQRHLHQILELFEQQGREIFAILTRLVLREAVAEELMQELFIKLSSYKGLDKVGNLAAYARKVAINLAFDWRSRQKLSLMGLDEVDESSHLASGDNSPLGELVRKEGLEELVDAIGQLRGASREVFIMRHVQQQSYEDIAEQMGKTPQQVRALCSKALAHLRYVLSDNEKLS